MSSYRPEIKPATVGQQVGSMQVSMNTIQSVSISDELKSSNFIHMLRQLRRLSFNLSDTYFFRPIKKFHICLMTSQVEHRSGVRASPTGQKRPFLGRLMSDSNKIKFAVVGSFSSITLLIFTAIGCETTERPQGTSADTNNLPLRGICRFLSRLMSDSDEVNFAVIGSFSSITAPIVMAIGCETTERRQETSADTNKVPFRGKWRSLSRLMPHPNEIKFALIGSFSTIYHCADFHGNRSGNHGAAAGNVRCIRPHGSGASRNLIHKLVD